MEVIVPAAGLSSRFPGTKPKYLLADYKNDLMISNALFGGLLYNYKIHVGILQEHDEKYNASEYLKNEVHHDINIAVLQSRTLGPADTVYQTIKQNNIDPNTPIFIKDCDSFFKYEHVEGSAIYSWNLDKTVFSGNVANKSFVTVDDDNYATKIVEKKIASNRICVGGYKFESAQQFCDLFEQISKDHEIFVSEVVDLGIRQGHGFKTVDVENYTDVGTLDDWLKFNNKPTIFCDIDGTIVHKQSRHGSDRFGTNPVILEHNVAHIKNLIDQGCTVIFTTARPKKYHDVTRRMLDRMGFQYCQLISGLNNSYRILINDFDTLNPYPSARCVNIPSNEDTLEKYTNDNSL